jgi:hypothetical protein
MEIPQKLFIYTLHFVIVLGSSGELSFQAGVKGVRGDGNKAK